jgi:D-xylose 1-dehydrogenase (NADP+, D-xylono-1,5-lactone-forming)
MPVKWGILSTARINQKFITGARQAAEVDVVAVASRTRESAERYANEHGIERAYARYDDLLEDPEVEAVYISLPNSMHVEWTVRALESGKHVLCEKPLSRRPDDVARAFDIAERQGLLLSEAFMYRHHPQSRRVTELVQSGALGALKLVRTAFSFEQPAPGNVRLSRELDGGALMDVGCYCVSATRLIAGEPQTVTAQQVTGGDGVDVAFAGTLLCPDDVLAHFDAGMSYAVRDELEVVGEHGSVFLDDPWHCVEPVIELRQGGATERIEIEAADSYQLEAENMSNAIRGREPLLLGREDALGQARAIEALYEAADSERAVQVQPA